MVTTPTNVPPTATELADAARTIRHWTLALEPGGIGIRWRNLNAANQRLLVDLTDQRQYESPEWRRLLAAAAGYIRERDLIDIEATR